jgi:uncharacterized iron-regulated protein
MNLLPLLVRVIALLALAGTAASAAEVFSGESGAALTSSQVLESINSADIVLLGEVHTDAAGHFWQQELLRELVAADDNWLLSLEEFDRSQQADLNQFAAGELTGEQLKAIRNFVGPGVKEHWLEWNLPKLQIARDAKVPMLASNAPLKYSRMVRNKGCDSLASLPADQRALVDCPLAAVDPDYQLRFYQTLQRVSRSSQAKAMKPLSNEQTEKMFRAHRVWDATMAESVVNARRATNVRIVHIVGNFHTDYNGGLVQELRARDPEARILVISIRPGRATTLPATDQGRANIMVYRGG